MKAKQKALGSAIPHIGAKALNGRKTDVDRVSLLGFSGRNTVIYWEVSFFTCGCKWVKYCVDTYCNVNQ